MDGWTMWAITIANNIVNNSNDLCHCLACSYVLFFFQGSCAYDNAHDVHNETGSASRVSRLVTVPSDPFTRPTAPFLSEWVKCQPRNTQNGGTTSIRDSDGTF